MSAPTVDRAEVYWDDQGPGNAGWWLRYHVDGTEDGCEIDGDEDDSTETLAASVAIELASYGAVVVKVIRGEQPRGRISVDGGEVTDWRAS